jgi:capsular exopolysaccharide synthesis family protein
VKGLSNIIVNESTFEQALHKDVIKNVDIITSGPIPPNPSELLHSKGFENILMQNFDEYDFILIDSPPVLPISDAKTIARHSNGIVIVADIRHVTEDELKRTKKELLHVKGNILGVVVNRVSAKNAKYYDYSYRYEYTHGED